MVSSILHDSLRHEAITVLLSGCGRLFPFSLLRPRCRKAVSVYAWPSGRGWARMGILDCGAAEAVRAKGSA